MTLRKSIIALTLLEAVQALQEQQAPPPPPPEPAAPAAPPEPVTGAPEAPSSGGVATDAETGEALTLDAILERLNIIRSGKSFSDPAVYANLSNWYQKLPPDEQTKLNESLKTIGAIVQNQQPEVAQPPAPEQPAAPPTPPPAPAETAAPPSPLPPPAQQ